MKISFFTLLLCLTLICWSIPLSAAPLTPRIGIEFLSVVYDTDEDDEDGEEEEGRDPEDTGEEDEDAGEPPPKDDFVEKKPKDEFALEQRSEEVYEYKEPEIVVAKQPTFLYLESSTDSRKIFEIFKGDELIVIEEQEGWILVEFLGKQGWVERSDVSSMTYTVYRLFCDLSVGLAYSPGIENYKMLGNYSVSVFYGVHEYFMVGGEFKALSVDSDVLYAGGGGVIRSHIPYLESKRSRTLLSASGGYFRMPETPAYKGSGSRPGIITFGGGYFSAALEHVVRVSDPVYVGGGFEFMYAAGEGKDGAGQTLHRDFWTVGGRIKVMFNIWE